MNPFDCIVGHLDNCELLTALHSRGKLPHALLFTGPEGIGKLAVARALAHYVCRESVASEEERVAIDSLIRVGNLPDLHLLTVEEERSEITVDQVRAFCGELALKPYSAKVRVGIVDKADRLNAAASNALLKTLEEPPPSTFILLVSAAPQRLVETILSRCQGLPFKLLTESEVAQVLAVIFPDLETRQRLSLGALCNGSLAALAIDKFIHPLTGQISEQKTARIAAEERLEKIRNYRTTLSPLLESPPSIATLLGFASDGANSPESLDAFFPALQQTLREGILRGGRDSGRFAEGLQAAILAENRIKERNLNPVLAVSELLLGIFEQSPQ